jgi:acetyl esterase
MLAAMRPRDSRYAALPLLAGAAVDATVRCVIMCWPVIDPLGRYEYAKRLKERGGAHAEFADRVLPSHDQFWLTEEAMAEGSPTRALERGEKVALPPALYIQAPSISRIRAPTVNASLKVIAKPAAISSWNCSKAKPRAS